MIRKRFSRFEIFWFLNALPKIREKKLKTFSKPERIFHFSKLFLALTNIKGWNSSNILL